MAFALRALFLALAYVVAVGATPFKRVIVHHDEDDFAAREIRRYSYLTTGAMPDLAECPRDDVTCVEAVVATAAPEGSVELILLVHPNSAVLQHPQLAATGLTSGRLAELNGETGGHAVVSGTFAAHPTKLVVGAGKFGRLYAAYTFAEALGVRFELAGEVLPDPTAAGGLPLAVGASSSLPTLAAFNPTPMFDYRGLQPFHDFPEGPDWWDTQHYKQIITQLSKLKANFIGLHTYPFRRESAPTTGTNEPTVWVGTVDGLNADGSVKPEAAYPTSYANTIRNEWGYGSLNTSSYSWGTAEIFESDCWAPPPTDADSCPYPKTPEAAAAFFERTAAMLNASFGHGNQLGVQGCVGTETPLSFPQPVQHYPCTATPAVCYRDAETRVMPYQVSISDGVNSMERCAFECHGKGYAFAGVEYGQACFCGNATPPASARIDPSQCQMLCPGNPSEMCGGEWAVAVFAVNCTGGPAPGPPAPPSSRPVYDGIFTRLKAKIPTLTWYWVWTPEGWEWGKMNSQNPVFTDAVADLSNAMASRDAINPGLKMATNGWVVGPLPDRSIFDKTLPTSWDAITSIDLNTGHSPVDPAYQQITRHPKWAIPWMEDDPDLTAPQLWVNRTLEHMDDAKKYGCSGLLGIHWRTKETGPQIAAMLQKSWNPTLTSQQFWSDWAAASFGSNVANDVAAVFESVDSFAMPLVVGWSGGPGQMRPGCKPTSTFDFVDKLEAIAPQVSGAVNAARFDFWRAHFEYMRGIAETECAWDGFNKALAAAKAGPTAAAKATLLKSRIGLISNATAMITALQMSFADVGTLGTYMNIEGHSLYGAITAVEDQLTQILGQPLPAAAMPPTVFGGKNVTIVVPTLRTTLGVGEPFDLRALALAPTASPACKLTLFTSAMGSGQAFSATAFSNVGRSVFEIGGMAVSADFEYYITADCGAGLRAAYPAGAPAVTQTVVIMQ